MINQFAELITSDPQIMAGKPVIHGTRLTVEYILNLIEHGGSVESILKEYPGLTVDDVQACLSFASGADELRAHL